MIVYLAELETRHFTFRVCFVVNARGKGSLAERLGLARKIINAKLEHGVRIHCATTPGADVNALLKLVNEESYEISILKNGICYRDNFPLTEEWPARNRSQKGKP